MGRQPVADARSGRGTCPRPPTTTRWPGRTPLAVASVRAHRLGSTRRRARTPRRSTTRLLRSGGRRRTLTGRPPSRGPRRGTRPSPRRTNAACLHEARSTSARRHRTGWRVIEPLDARVRSSAILGAMKLYFAGPLFTTPERTWNAEVTAALRAAGHEVFLPQEQEPGKDGPGIFATDVGGIDWADGLVAIMDGPDPDSGTCWEVGYAFGRRSRSCSSAPISASGRNGRRLQPDADPVCDRPDRSTCRIDHGGHRRYPRRAREDRGGPKRPVAIGRERQLDGDAARR